MNTLGLIAIIVLFGLAIVSAISQARIDYAALLEAGRKQFNGVNIPSADPRFALNGSTAQIMKEEETGNDPRQSSARDYVLTVYARNPQGEYFMFRSGSPKPFVKHMEHRMAKALLREKYLSPPT